jgi:DNA-directed RNA polymerase subunit beta
VHLDLILNTLGIPSRINLGQVYESILGIAGFFICESFEFSSFNLGSRAYTASRRIVLDKLCEARVKTHNTWIFNPDNPGKIPVFDRRVCEFIPYDATLGESYILKLVHMVCDKVNSRTVGPYSLLTVEPVGGRKRNGGQRVGEIEIWALERFGVAHVIREILTIKSDYSCAKNTNWMNILAYSRHITRDNPDALRVLISEFRGLNIDLIFLECR